MQTPSLYCAGDSTNPVCFIFAHRFLDAALSFCRVLSEISLIGLTFTIGLAISNMKPSTELWPC